MLFIQLFIPTEGTWGGQWSQISPLAVTRPKCPNLFIVHRLKLKGWRNGKGIHFSQVEIYSDWQKRSSRAGWIQQSLSGFTLDNFQHFSPYVEIDNSFSQWRDVLTGHIRNRSSIFDRSALLIYHPYLKRCGLTLRTRLASLSCKQLRFLLLIQISFHFTSCKWE